MADWSTWDGLNDAPEERWEVVTFGDAAKSKKKDEKVPAAKAAFKPKKSIAKKERALAVEPKKARATGLMKVRFPHCHSRAQAGSIIDAPFVLPGSQVVESPVQQAESPEPITSPFDPAKVATKNPYSVLMEITEAEEAAKAAEAACAAKKSKKTTFAEVCTCSPASQIHAALHTTR